MAGIADRRRQIQEAEEAAAWAEEEAARLAATARNIAELVLEAEATAAKMAEKAAVRMGGGAWLSDCRTNCNDVQTYTTVLAGAQG